MYRHPTPVQCPYLLTSNLSSPVVRYSQQAKQLMVLGTRTVSNQQEEQAHRNRNELVFRFWRISSAEVRREVRQATYLLSKKYNVVDCAWARDHLCILWLEQKQRHIQDNKEFILILRLTPKNELEYCKNLQMLPLSTAAKQGCELNEVAKELSYDQEKSRIELIWKYKTKSILTWKSAQGQQAGYRLVVRCQSITLTNVKSQISLGTTSSFYFGVRSSYTQAIVLFNIKIQHGDTQGQAEDGPWMLIYEAIPAIPHHLSEGERSRAVSLRLCKMHPNELTRSELQQSWDVPIGNYVLGVDRQDSELTGSTNQQEPDDESEINEIIHTILVQRHQAQSAQHHEIQLTILTTHGRVLKIIACAINSISLKATVFSTTRIELDGSTHSVLASGIARSCIWVKVSQHLSKESAAQDLYILDTEKNSEYRLIHKVRLRNSQSRPLLHLDRECRMLVMQMGQEGLEAIQMCEKKLIYLKLIRQIWGEPEGASEDAVIEQVSRCALELL